MGGSGSLSIVYEARGGGYYMAAETADQTIVTGPFPTKDGAAEQAMRFFHEELHTGLMGYGRLKG
jgi:hypothetical protein